MANEQMLTMMLGFTLYMTFFLVTFYFVIITVKVVMSKMKEKKALALIEQGYAIETVDSNGVPHLLKKGSYVNSVSKITKKEKKK
jgi:hypothetical protein